MSGITCGTCTDSLGKAIGSVIKHDTVQDVRDCFERKFAFDAMMDEFDVFEEVSGGAFCDDYEVHDEHVYTALNGESYRCSGYSLADLLADTAEAEELCEHGMSASLCAGPMHYPADNYEAA